MRKQFSPYRRLRRRAFACWLLLFVIAQFAAPMHGWLEASPGTIHHDGFVWTAMAGLSPGCESPVEAGHASDSGCCCRDDGRQNEGGIQHDGCHLDDGCLDHADTHHDGGCSDDGGCGDGGCGDDNCGSCCHHQPIQSAVHDCEFDGALAVLRTAAPAILDILPGIHPNPFLPPRSRA